MRAVWKPMMNEQYIIYKSVNATYSDMKDCGILVRRTIAWNRIETMQQYREAYRGRGPHGLPLSYVEKWNNDFSVSYWDYRAKLKEIAKKSLQATGIPLLRKRELADIIIPIDDDDWLHPEIGIIVTELFNRHIIPESQAVCWHNSRFAVNNGEVKMDIVSGAKDILSCGYAVRSSLPRKHWFDHSDMKDYRSKNWSLVHIHKKHLLSMYVRHQGAVWLLKKFGPVNLPFHSKMRGDFPSPFKWCKPYAVELVDYIRSIHHNRAVRFL